MELACIAAVISSARGKARGKRTTETDTATAVVVCLGGMFGDAYRVVRDENGGREGGGNAMTAEKITVITKETDEDAIAATTAPKAEEGTTTTKEITATSSSSSMSSVYVDPLPSALDPLSPIAEVRVTSSTGSITGINSPSDARTAPKIRSLQVTREDAGGEFGLRLRHSPRSEERRLRLSPRSD